MKKLLKLSFKLKLNILRCYFFNKNTDEHRLAKQYQHTLNNLKNNAEEINALVLKTENLKEKFHDKKAIMNLLQSVILFLQNLGAIER
jgi:hypothetical protein